MEKNSKKKYLAYRKNILENEYNFLNPEQRKAVFASSGPVLVLAGAGSGKTTTLINRIAYLIKYGDAYESEQIPLRVVEENIPELEKHARKGTTPPPQWLAVNTINPWNILAITFTNKAAGEIRSRIDNVLGDVGSGIWAYTFHSACARILRRDCWLLGYKPSFTIYDTDDTVRLIKDCMEFLSYSEKEFNPRDMAKLISEAKDKLFSPARMLQESGNDIRCEAAAHIYAIYQERLLLSNAMDFDDLIIQTVKLLKQSEATREYYCSKFTHILVDEYQDTNFAQYTLVNLLAKPHRNLCVVGDDDQSIYAFRGADVKNILDFEKDYPDARIFRLEQNYRSTSLILDAANAVIENNPVRKGKNLWTDREGGECIVLYEATDEQGEASFVAETIINNTAKGSTWGEHTVLYRMNAQSNAIEQAFRYNGVPYRIISGIRFFDRMEIRDMMSYLQVINNPADTLRLSRIVNTPARGIGEKSYSEALRAAQENNITPFEVLESARRYGLSERAATKMEGFAYIILSLFEKSAKLPLDEFYDEVMEKSGYRYALESKPTDENRTRLENILELKTNIVHYMRMADTPTLSGFLEEMSLITDIDSYDENADAVKLMTIHSAKGLEFPKTFIVGMEEGIFPGIRSTESENGMEEERRLAYVGITRAKDELFLSYASRRTLFGRTTANAPSRFIDEIPEKCIERKSQQKSGYYSDESRNNYRRSDYAVGSMDTLFKSGHDFKSQKAGISSAEHKSATAEHFAAGENVEHKRFGRGLVLSRTELSGDAVLLIKFDKDGEKKMMESFAGQFMKKIKK